MQITTSAPDALSSPIQLDWANIDTVLLDMDGTLLDLNYDNHVWNEVVPEAYATLKNISLQDAQTALFEHMKVIKGSIEFYSFDYWDAYTGLNLVELHRRMVDLVAYRHGALEFLRWLRAQNKFVAIATNAHPSSIMVKEERIPISQEVDAVASSATLQAPKEAQDYWHELNKIHPFNPERTLFVDDNEPVLAAAQAYGIRHLLCIHTPDSERPTRTGLGYPAFDHFSEISEIDAT